MPARLELVAQRAEYGVVGRLAREVEIGQGDAEGGVDGVEVGLGEVDELTPEGEGLAVAGLQGDHPGAGAGVEIACTPWRFGLLGEVELHPGRLIEGIGVSDEKRRLGRVPADVEEVLDEHPEGGAPVADVVLPHDVVPEVLESAGQRVADDRRAQVADVHLLGDVGRRVVDRDVLALLERHTDALVGRHVLQKRREPRVGEGEVDEAGAAHLDGVAHAVDVERVDDLGRDLTRRHTDPLGERQRGVDLHVGELRRRSTGSASRYSSPNAAAIADWTLGVSATSGETMPASLGAARRSLRRRFPRGPSGTAPPPYAVGLATGPPPGRAGSAYSPRLRKPARRADSSL